MDGNRNGDEATAAFRVPGFNYKQNNHDREIETRRRVKDRPHG